MKKLILGFAILSLIACNRSGGNKAILPVVESEEEVEMTESFQGNEGHEHQLKTAVIKPIEVSSEEIKKIVEKSKAEMPKALEIKTAK